MDKPLSINKWVPCNKNKVVDIFSQIKSKINSYLLISAAMLVLATCFKVLQCRELKVNTVIFDDGHMVRAEPEAVDLIEFELLKASGVRRRGACVSAALPP